MWRHRPNLLLAMWHLLPATTPEYQSTTATTVTVDQHSATCAAAPALKDPPTFANGKTGFIMTIDLKDESYKTWYEKLGGLNKMYGTFAMQLDAGKNKLIAFGVVRAPSYLICFACWHHD